MDRNERLLTGGVQRPSNGEDGRIADQVDAELVSTEGLSPSA